MKKSLIILLIVICFSGISGCKEEGMINENIKLKAQVAVLEQQLELCSKDLRHLKIPIDNNKYDPNVTNPNNNETF